jgi:hypothetical protein
MSTAPRLVSKVGRWLFASIAGGATAVVWPIAATFYSPTAIGYVQLPGVILFVLLAASCVACFILCPRRPFSPKLITLLLATHALYWALYASAYYWIHSVQNASTGTTPTSQASAVGSTTFARLQTPEHR